MRILGLWALGFALQMVEYAAGAVVVVIVLRMMGVL